MNSYTLMFLTMFISSSAFADTLPNAEALIEKCSKQAHLKWDTGITTTMNDGSRDYSHCLEKTILKLTERIYDKEKLKEAKAALKTQFKQLSTAAIGFSWKIDNENKWCDCGTMMHVTSFSLYFRILEDMVRDVISVEKLHTQLK